MFSGIFSTLLRGGFRGIIALFLGLALLGALWNASLFNLSRRATSIDILTQVGIKAINPVLMHSGLGGLSQSRLTSITKNCTGNAKVPGLKVAIQCSRLKDASSLDAATTVVYAEVAASYYDNGIAGIFDANIPQPIKDILSGQSIVPQISSVPTPSGTFDVPSLPNNPLLQLGSSVGFSLGTLTLAGHADEQSKALWFGGAALVLLLLLGLTSKGGKRLTAMGHALIGGALPGVIGLGLVWFLAQRYPEQAAPFSKLLGDIGGAFAPIYIGAAVIGVALYAGAFVWRLVVKPVGAGIKDAVPAAIGAGMRTRGGEAGAGGPAGGYGGYGAPQPRYGDARPPYGQPQAPYTPPGGPRYQSRYPGTDRGMPQTPRTPGGAGWPPPSQPPSAGSEWPPSPQSPVGSGWPQPNPSQTRPEWGDPTQDLPTAGGGSRYAPQSPYPSRPSPNAPSGPSDDRFAQPQPPGLPQLGRSADEDWPPRR
jgi:hypothetical protein